MVTRNKQELFRECTVHYVYIKLDWLSWYNHDNFKFLLCQTGTLEQLEFEASNEHNCRWLVGLIMKNRLKGPCLLVSKVWWKMEETVAVLMDWKLVLPNISLIFIQNNNWTIALNIKFLPVQCRCSPKPNKKCANVIANIMHMMSTQHS